MRETTWLPATLSEPSLSPAEAAAEATRISCRGWPGRKVRSVPNLPQSPNSDLHEFAFKLVSAAKIDEARQILANPSTMKVHVLGTIVARAAPYNPRGPSHTVACRQGQDSPNFPCMGEHYMVHELYMVRYGY